MTCMPAYTEPKYLLGDGVSVVRDKKSDIYSLGILLWELSSGVPPFHGLSTMAILLEISKDRREKIIENTPLSYTDLYCGCWSSDPNQRPALDKIKLEPEKLSAKSTVEFIINNVTALDHQAKTPLTESLIFVNNALKESKTKICDYNDFTILDKIGGSNSGYVEKARWKSHECIVALKSLKVEMDLGFILLMNVELLQTLYEISEKHHPNIRHFYGIDKENNERYFLIFQHADSNLSDYLKENFEKLTWNDKIRMATEIAMGLIHLHEGIKRIIHQELHSMNILVHENRMLIADFSMPKWKSVSTITTSHGIPAYVDPRYLANHKYELDEKSNVYSFGVILWEISSGRSPFKSLKGRDEITYQIFSGKRETPVEGTPEPYIQLYSRCWDYDPDKRPEIQEELEDIRAIKKSGILATLTVEQKTNTKNLPKDYKSVSPISDQKNVKFLDQMESSEQIEINNSVLKIMSISNSFLNGLTKHHQKVELFQKDSRKLSQKLNKSMISNYLLEEVEMDFCLLPFMKNVIIKAQH
ncbi:kinase-like protein [Gigaspora margarita]|uniref:Kinase-like protein n=1 Tax=Gigaspora margarita TaxID=4874 RepID=A0A8H3X9U0_GIGMA|nr:kinase-like protein [Gigaspora margarita]